MFGTIDKSEGVLFFSRELSDILRSVMQAMIQEVERLDADRFLNTATEDLKRHLAEKYHVVSLKLMRDQWYADTREVQVDVRYDQNRWIDDRSKAAMISGERVNVHVPFDGSQELFFARANTFNSNPPRALIETNELILRYDTPADHPRDLSPIIARDIEQHLGWQSTMIDQHNASLAASANEAIQKRRTRLLAQSQRAEALGIPIRRREDAPKTYAVPAARRKAMPMLPPASTAQFKPEPVWAMEQYEHALKIMQDMALVMERSPQAFKSMDEESLRQHFLVQLNG